MNEVSKDFEVLNSYGIHARPAAMFVKTAGRFQAEITVAKDGIIVSGKSIMGLLTLECHQGSMLTISAEGSDAPEAVAALGELFKRKFDED